MFAINSLLCIHESCFVSGFNIYPLLINILFTRNSFLFLFPTQYYIVALTL